MSRSRKPAVLRALAAVAETLLPSVHVPNMESSDLTTFFEWSGGSDPASLDDVLRFGKRNLPAKHYWGFTSILWLLSTRLGTFALAGLLCLSRKFPFVLSFIELPIAQREKILQALALSPLSLHRRIFLSLKNLTVVSLFSTATTDKSSPWAPVFDYVGIGSNVPDQSMPVNPDTQKAEALLATAVTDLQVVGLQVDAEQLVPYFQSRGYTAWAPEPAEQDLAGNNIAAVLEFDAVIVGSGAGGSITAATLSKAGLSVLVLEKSSWTRTADMTWQERQAWDSMYENGGIMLAEDGKVAVVAGSTLGGGTKVNWAGSLRTPDHVRQEWAENFNLPVLTSDRFSKILDTVCERLSVNEGICEHSEQNQALKRGLEAENLHVERYSRNCVGESCSSLCSMGCKQGMKMSGDVTFLADAVDHGTRVLISTYAERVLRDKSGAVFGVLACDGGRATSAPHQPSIRVLIKAPIVVSSGGALHTPALLLRSNIMVNNNVGHNLKLHPVTGMLALFPPTMPPTDIWRGAPMTVLSKHLANRENSGYGGIIITPVLQPGMYVSVSPWKSGQEFKQLLSCAPRSALAIVIARDKGSGRVTIDKEGRPQFQYWPSAFDQETLIQGLEVMARCWVAAGAEKLVVGCSDALTYKVNEEHSPERLKAFTDTIRKKGIKPYYSSIFSAHQMGSCAMGSNPKTSVCDPQGQVWGVEGLYIADASAMPTCSGVNPMITTYALSLLVAQNISEKFAKGRAKRAPVNVNYE